MHKAFVKLTSYVNKKLAIISDIDDKLDALTKIEKLITAVHNLRGDN